MQQKGLRRAFRDKFKKQNKTGFVEILKFFFLTLASEEDK